MLRHEPSPAGLLATGGALDAHDALLVVYGDHHPRPATEQEATHALDEAIDKVLLERTQVAAGLGVYAVQDGRAEHGVELEEVLLPEDALGLLPHAEEAPGLEKVVLLEHEGEQLVVLRPADVAKIRNLAEDVPASFPADATVLVGESQELVDQYRPAASLVANRLDPLVGR